MSSKSQRTKIISVGDEETSLGFKLSGIFDTFTVEPENAGPILRKLADDPDLAILIVTEEVANMNSDLIKRIRYNPYPVIVEVPGKKAKFSAGEDRVKKLVKMALGIDIE